MLFHRHPEIKGRKKCENVGLDKCHQQFQEAHEYAESHGYRRDRQPERAFDIPENEDKAHETEDDNMPGAHVSKETDHEDEWLGKDAEQLNERHQRQREFQPPGHPWRIVDFFPVMFISAEGCDNKGKHRHDSRHSQVACYIRSERKERDKAHQVVQEDEEK